MLLLAPRAVFARADATPLDLSYCKPPQPADIPELPYVSRPGKPRLAIMAGICFQGGSSIKGDGAAQQCRRLNPNKEQQYRCPQKPLEEVQMAGRALQRAKVSKELDTVLMLSGFMFDVPPTLGGDSTQMVREVRDRTTPLAIQGHAYKLDFWRRLLFVNRTALAWQRKIPTRHEFFPECQAAVRSGRNLSQIAYCGPQDTFFPIPRDDRQDAWSSLPNPNVHTREDGECTSLIFAAWARSEYDGILFMDTDQCIYEDPLEFMYTAWRAGHHFLAQAERTSRSYLGVNTHLMWITPNPPLCQVFREKAAFGDYMPHQNGGQDIIETVFSPHSLAAKWQAIGSAMGVCTHPNHHATRCSMEWPEVFPLHEHSHDFSEARCISRLLHFFPSYAGQQSGPGWPSTDTIVGYAE